MAPAYSHRFALTTGTTHVIDYVVPDGRRAVVKSLSAYCSAGVGEGLGLYIGLTPVWYAPIASNSGVMFGGLMIVANAGETLRLSGTANVTGQVSGYLLDATG